MRNLNKIFFLLAFFLFHTIVLSQDTKLIPIKKLSKDLDLLVSYVEAHPAPYRHITEKEFKALVKKTKKAITAPMGQLEFYKLASPLYAAIKDGHTSMRLPGSHLKKQFRENGIFPFKVHLTDENRIFIIDNYGQDSTIALGAEILALNDMPTAKFISNIDPYISYELEIFRNALIEDGFNFYILLVFGSIKEIKINYLSDKERTHTIAFTDFKNIEIKMDEAEVEKQKKIAIGQPYEYEKIKDGIGLLKIYSFAPGDNLDKYDLFLRDMFRKIRRDKIQSLIIDVRGNYGGYPKAVSNLLHYISEKHFKTMAISETKVSGVYRDYFNNMIPNRDLAYSGIFFQNGRHAIDINSLFAKEEGSVIKEDAKFNEAPKEEYYEFTGDVYLLTDRRSFSASSSFAATFRCYQLGLIIGSETGGTKVFHANSMLNQLPNSKIVCGVATTRLYTACYLQEDVGIQPDLEVIPTVQELVAKTDPALNYTLRVIKKVKKMRNE